VEGANLCLGSELFLYQKGIHLVFQSDIIHSNGLGVDNWGRWEVDSEHLVNCVAGIECSENECSQQKLRLASNLYKGIGCTGAFQRLG
jgi:hypothetical protein